MYFSFLKLRFTLVAVAVFFTVGCADMVGRFKQNLTPSQPEATAAEQGETIESAVHVAKDGTSTFYAYRGLIEVTANETGERVTLKPGEVVAVSPDNKVTKSTFPMTLPQVFSGEPIVSKVDATALASVRNQLKLKMWPNKIKRP